MRARGRAPDARGKFTESIRGSESCSYRSRKHFNAFCRRASDADTAPELVSREGYHTQRTVPMPVQLVAWEASSASARPEKVTLVKTGTSNRPETNAASPGRCAPVTTKFGLANAAKPAVIEASRLNPCSQAARPRNSTALTRVSSHDPSSVRVEVVSFDANVCAVPPTLVSV